MKIAIECKLYCINALKRHSKLELINKNNNNSKHSKAIYISVQLAYLVRNIINESNNINYCIVKKKEEKNTILFFFWL